MMRLLILLGACAVMYGCASFGSDKPVQVQCAYPDAQVLMQPVAPPMSIGVYFTSESAAANY